MRKSRKEQSLSIRNDSRDLQGTYAYHGGKLGLLTMYQPDAAIVNASKLAAGAKAKALASYNTRNFAEMEFTVTPVDIYRMKPIVKYDVTRTADAQVKEGPFAPFRPRNLPALPSYIDQTNDDSSDSSNDNDMFSAPLLLLTGNGNHNRLYSIDGPGRDLEQRVMFRMPRLQHWLNAWEFVRVKIAAGDFVNQKELLQGSRMSEFANWHSWIDANAIADPQNAGNTIWDRPAAPNARNQIQMDLQAHPNFVFQE